MQEKPDQARPKHRWLAWVLAESSRLDIAMPWERDTGGRPSSANTTRE